MDEQKDNQNQPGTSYQPAQPTQAGVNQQPIQPDYVPSQSPNQQVQQADASSSLNVKKIGFFAGTFIIGVIIIAVIVAIFAGSGSALPLTTIEDDQLTFSVDLPEGWNANVSSSDSLNIVNATPPDPTPGDITGITFSHSTTPVENVGFVQETDYQAAIRTDLDFQNDFNIEIEQVVYEPYRSSDRSSLRLAYLQRDKTTKIEHVIERYFFQQQDGSVVLARFAYSPTFPEVGEIISDVIESYKLK